MESCRYYGTCSNLHNEIIAIKNENILQDSSLKSIHKRLDEASTERHKSNDIIVALLTKIYERDKLVDKQEIKSKDRGVFNSFPSLLHGNAYHSPL